MGSLKLQSNENLVKRFNYTSSEPYTDSEIPLRVEWYLMELQGMNK